MHKLQAIMILVFFMVCDMPLGQAETIKLCRADNHAVHMAATPFVLELYKQIGENPRIIDLPTRRSLLETVNGRCQAEIGRVPAAFEKFPSLLHIDIPVYHVRGYAYALDPIPTVKNWSDLNEMSVGFIMGEVHAESRLPETNRLAAKDYPGLLKLLERGRVEAIVGLNIGMQRLDGLGHLYRSPAALTNLPLFHLVHKSRPDIVKRLTRALKVVSRETMTP